MTRAFENRGAASVARSELPRRYPSYRSEHYVSHHVAHVFRFRCLVDERKLRDEWNKPAKPRARYISEDESQRVQTE